MVRRFVVVGHRASTDPGFSLDDLAGAAGRMDVMARCVNATFMVSHGLREDVETTLVLLGPPRPPRSIRLVGQELRGLNPDERSTAARLRRALEYEGQLEREVSPGVHASGAGFAAAVEAAEHPILLTEDGEDLRGRSLPDDPTFLLSDDRDFDEEELTVAGDAARLRVGPVSLHVDQVIAIVHNELDRRDSLG